MTQKAAAPTPPRGPRLVPGAAIAGGRYRLLDAHGGARGMRFWRAQDGQLNREVGLTFVDPDQRSDPTSESPAAPAAVLNRTRRLGQLQTPGVARILDVVRGASGGVVVTEWVPGSSLADVAGDGPSAAGAARAVRTLAAAAEAAHRAGTALGIDHPDRIRVSVDGEAVLAFPAVAEGTDRAADVRGLGAVLYALLLNRWPLTDPDGNGVATVTTAQARGGTVGGFAPAAPDLGRADRPIAPADVNPTIPFEISAVAIRALDGGPSIRTAGTVQHVLDQATVVDLATDVLPRVEDERTPVSVAPISRTRKERLLGEGQAGKRNGALLIGTALFLIFLVFALILWLANPFGDTSTNDVDAFLGDETTTSAPAATSGAAITPVLPTAVTIFDPDGEPDAMATQNVGNILSGGQPPWQTSQYRGTARYGGLKEGLGLMFRLDRGSSVTSVEITTTTPGFTVEFRTADGARPNLNATSVVGSGTVDKRVTRFTLDAAATGRYLLIWIPELAQVEPGRYQAIVKQITFAGS